LKLRLHDVPTVQTAFKISQSLKREFDRAVREHPDFDTATDFFEGAITAFVLQTRRKEPLKFPLEFVTSTAAEPSKTKPG
jgi:hypothetical protein